MLAYLQELPVDIMKAQDELDDRFKAAICARDVEAAMGCLWDSPDLVLVLWGTIVRGADAARAALAAFFEEHPFVRLEPDECFYIPAGDAVIAVGTATYQLKDRSGAAKTIVERWTDLRRQIDGRWVYVLDHATVVPA